jgi:hypothetical protein
MEGWIKIHRQIKEHWLWKSERRLKWWLDILLTVNHTDTKILIRGTLMDCKRGQSVRSLETWAKDWNVTKGAVRDFFKLLQSDSMLTIESTLNSTRITVCNYDNYQTSLYAEETPRKHKTNGQETLRVPKQECKEGIKNEKNIVPPTFEMVKKYCDERKNGIDPQHFIDTNSLRGWVYGKNRTKIVDWQACIRTWEQYQKKDQPKLMMP